MPTLRYMAIWGLCLCLQFVNRLRMMLMTWLFYMTACNNLLDSGLCACMQEWWGTVIPTCWVVSPMHLVRVAGW